MQGQRIGATRATHEPSEQVVLTGDLEHDAAIGVLTVFEQVELSGAGASLPAPLRAALLKLAEVFPRC